MKGISIGIVVDYFEEIVFDLFQIYPEFPWNFWENSEDWKKMENVFLKIVPELGMLSQRNLFSTKFVILTAFLFGSRPFIFILKIAMTHYNTQHDIASELVLLAQF